MKKDHRGPAVSSTRLFGDFGWTADDLKAFAIARCIDIFKHYTRTEVDGQPKCVRDAWDIGSDACTPNKVLTEKGLSSQTEGTSR